MTLASDPAFPLVSLTIEPWSDPVIDELGHDPRSAYVERFWLPILGPSTIWFLRRVVDQLDREPHGYSLDLVETARALGVGMRGGRNSPMLKTVERSCRFGAARMHGDSLLEVRRRLAPLSRAQVERLTPQLQHEHGDWIDRPRNTPSVDQMAQRARSLALSMLELGEDSDAVERQLHRWRFHPAMAHEALRWALAHREHPSTSGTSTIQPPARIPRPPRPTLVRSGRPAIGSVGLVANGMIEPVSDAAG
jgi:hypothetical protein